MKFVVKVASILVFVCALFSFGTQRVQAQLCGGGIVTVDPVNPTPGQTVTLTIILPGSAQTQNPVLCGRDAGADPISGYCFQIRGCNTGMGGTFGCAANSTFPVPYETFSSAQQIVDVGGQRAIRVTAVLNSSLTFWLEENLNRQARRRTYSPSECTVQVSDPLPFCSGNPFTVRGVRNGELISNFNQTDPVRVDVDWNSIQNIPTTIPSGIDYYVEIERAGTNNEAMQSRILVPFAEYQADFSPLTIGQWEVSLLTDFYSADGTVAQQEFCQATFSVTSDGEGSGVITPGSGSTPFDLCTQADPIDREDCSTCFTGNPPGIWTAVGCVRTTRDGMVSDFLKLGLGMAGGFVLLSILYGSFLLTTSSGDPKRVQEGQEMITSAVMGLLFVIFSITILRFIGISILNIPGL